MCIRDRCEAIAHTTLFAVGPAQDNDACPVEAAVNRRINAALASAEAALMAAFGDMRLLEIATEVAKPRLATPRP